MQRRAKSKRVLKAEERFKVAVTAYIIGKGARPDTFYDYVMDTSAGLLNITVYGDWIACRFDNVALGREFTNDCGRSCNPFSGKWNFHYTDILVGVETAFADFEFFLNRLLNWRPSPHNGD